MTGLTPPTARSVLGSSSTAGGAATSATSPNPEPRVRLEDRADLARGPGRAAAGGGRRERRRRAAHGPVQRLVGPPPTGSSSCWAAPTDDRSGRPGQRILLNSRAISSAESSSMPVWLENSIDHCRRCDPRAVPPSAEDADLRRPAAPAARRNVIRPHLGTPHRHRPARSGSWGSCIRRALEVGAGHHRVVPHRGSSILASAGAASMSTRPNPPAVGALGELEPVHRPESLLRTFQVQFMHVVPRGGC